MTVKETTNPAPKKLGNEDFGAWLMATRKEAGLSRNEVAERTGISYPYVSQLETGYRNPSASVVQTLSVVLGVDAGEMLARAFPPLMVNEAGTMEMLRDTFTKRPRLVAPGDRVTVLGIETEGPVMTLALSDGTTLTLKADRRAA